MHWISTNRPPHVSSTGFEGQVEHGAEWDICEVSNNFFTVLPILHGLVMLLLNGE